MRGDFLQVSSFFVSLRSLAVSKVKPNPLLADMGAAPAVSLTVGVVDHSPFGKVA